jgi:Flp pilus assembly protein TadD
LGRILFRARRYRESAQALQRAVELEPRNAEALFRLGDTYAELHRYDEAVAAYEKTAQLTPRFEGPRAAIARVDALQGKKEQARKLLADVRLDPQALAAVYVALGEHDRAFGLLQAEAEHSRGLVLVNDPGYDSLRSDPRWPALLRRLNLSSH